MTQRGDEIDRRAFLGYAALLGASTVGGPLVPRPSLPATRHRGQSARDPFDIEEATVKDLQSAMEAGRVTARDLVQLYLERIDGLDQQGPALPRPLLRRRLPNRSRARPRRPAPGTRPR